MTSNDTNTLAEQAVMKWTVTIGNHVSSVFKAQPDLTQLEACTAVNRRLHDLFDSYPTACGIRVNPKGDKQIQVILTLDKTNDTPSIKIKSRFDVPSLIEDVVNG